MRKALAVWSVVLLLMAGCAQVPTGSSDTEKLHNAIALDDDGFVRDMVKSGRIGVNHRTATPGFPEGAPLVVVAARYGSLRTLRFLLSAGADVNARAPTGETALTGFSRFWRHWGLVFAVMTYFANLWPGWATISATMITYLVGGEPRWIAIGMLIVIGLILTLAPVVYVALERLQIVKVAAVGLLIVVAALFVITAEAWSSLPQIVTRATIPVEELVAQARPDSDGAAEPTADVEAAIRSDRRLSATQKDALLTVYRSYVAAADGEDEERG